jgi:WD40 repeat protein
VKDGQEIRTLKCDKYSYFSVAFSSDGLLLANSSGDSTIKIWRVQDGQKIRVLKGHTAPVRSVAFSPDGQTLATGSGDSTIKLWRCDG